MPRITRRDVGDGAVAIGAGTIVTVTLVLIGCAIAALLWWLGVFTSGVKGAGDVHRDQQRAGNREHWSATFNAEYQQIAADRDNLTILKRAATGAGATQQDRTNYTGAQLNCRQDVAQYNADAASTLGSPWIPTDLPSQIDATTYCGS